MAPGGTSSIRPASSSSPSSSRARTSRKPAPTPPRAAATSASGPPPSTRNTTRPSRASAGSTAASDRPRAAACQPHGARMALPDSASSGRTAAASRPSTQAVAQYASDRRSWFGRTGGWLRTSRMRRRPGPDPPASEASQPSDRAAEGPAIPRTAVAVPSTRLRRSDPIRAWTDPSEPPSRRWMKPRTMRMPSSNAIHGFRSRHWPPPGGLTRPP